MKKILFVVSLGILLSALVSPVYCSETETKTGYSGHFGDMDTDGDDHVNWKEFKQHFPHATTTVFKKADSSNDDLIDHDEWHEFKENHGYAHEEKD